jgi:hypothetical protein
MCLALKAQAAQFAANVLPIIREIQTVGHTSFNAIAGQFNARKVATANGGQWRHVQVRQILGRAVGGTRSPAKKCFNGTRPAEADIPYSQRLASLVAIEALVSDLRPAPSVLTAGISSTANRIASAAVGKRR